MQQGPRLLAHDIGVFVAPPGVGKTVVGTYLVAQRARSTLILVHRQPLLDQWVAQLSLFLGIDAKAIGQIGGGKRKPTGHLDVAMLQSLVRGDAVNDIVATYGHVIVDECHHVPAVSFERVLSNVKAKYVTGLTATLQRRDGHHPIIEMQLGPVRFTIDSKNQTARRPFAHRLIVRETQFRVAGDARQTPIQDLYRALVADESRNQLIVNDVLNALEEGRSPILLTERRDHLEYFEAQLRPAARNLVVLQGRHGREAEAGGNRANRRNSTERGAARAGHRAIHRRGVRRCAARHALPHSAGVVEGHARAVRRPAPPGCTRASGRCASSTTSIGEVPMLARMFEKRLRGYRAIGYAEEGELGIR